MWSTYLVDFSNLISSFLLARSAFLPSPLNLYTFLASTSRICPPTYGQLKLSDNNAGAISLERTRAPAGHPPEGYSDEIPVYEDAVVARGLWSGRVENRSHLRNSLSSSLFLARAFFALSLRTARLYIGKRNYEYSSTETRRRHRRVVFLAALRKIQFPQTLCGTTR